MSGNTDAETGVSKGIKVRAGWACLGHVCECVHVWREKERGVAGRERETLRNCLIEFGWSFDESNII